MFYEWYLRLAIDHGCWEQVSCGCLLDQSREDGQMGIWWYNVIYIYIHNYIQYMRKLDLYRFVQTFCWNLQTKKGKSIYSQDTFGQRQTSPSVIGFPGGQKLPLSPTNDKHIFLVCVAEPPTRDKYIYLSGWWFGTFFIFPYIENNNPNWLIFFIGVDTTNQLFIYLFKPGWFLNWRATLWQSALKVHPWLWGIFGRLSRIMRVRPGSDSADEHSKTPWQLQFQRVDNELGIVQLVFVEGFRDLYTLTVSSQGYLVLLHA